MESTDTSTLADILAQIGVASSAHHMREALDFCITRGRTVHDKVLRIVMRYVF